eukprot:9461054-Karenia_brevis.AAC.1
MVEGVGAALAAFSAVVDTRCQQSEETLRKHEKELEDLKTEIVVLKGQLAQVNFGGEGHEQMQQDFQVKVTNQVSEQMKDLFAEHVANWKHKEADKP